MTDTSSTRSDLVENVALSESKQTLLQYLREQGSPTVWFVQNIAAQIDIRGLLLGKYLQLMLSEPYDFAGW
jgi:hypothetical protein